MPIWSSIFCQEYTQQVNPTVEIDNGLSAYCLKYTGLDILFSTGSTKDQSLCACHMPSEQYENLANQISAEYVGISNIGLNDYCLVPQCASSAYKNASI